MPELNRHVAITITEDISEEAQLFSPSGTVSGIKNLRPTGVSIRYGINMIPTATVSFGPDVLPVICDFEKYRRHPVIIKVNSVTGCLVFKGLIDGISVSQSPGDLSLQMVVKHRFQVLSEINPKLLGYHPNGLDFTRRLRTLTFPRGDNGIMATKFEVLGGDNPVDLSLPIVEGMVEVLRCIVKNQLTWSKMNINTFPGLQFEALWKQANLLKDLHYPLALWLLEHVDTSFAPTSLTLADYFAISFVLSGICDTRTNLYDLLISLLDLVGCVLVIGNDKAYVVPNAGFLKMEHVNSVGFRQISNKANVTFPAQYTNLSFNDNGYRDISGIYAMSNENNSLPFDGIYVDENENTRGKGGILGVVMPYLFNFNNVAIAEGRPKLQRGIKERVENTKSAIDKTKVTTEQEELDKLKQEAEKEEETYIEDDKSADAKSKEMLDKMTNFANQWAQLKYYQEKYTDRAGGYSCLFNPNFAPGAIGTVYMRHPGVYIDHLVTAVSHDISVQVPNVGSAMTTISFNCGRLGSISSSMIGSGIDKFSLFDYTADKSLEFAEQFIEGLKKDE